MEISPGKNFSQSINFASAGPNPVYVKGKGGEILGVGRQIGLLHFTREDFSRFKRKVIAIDDPKSPDGEVELMDSECDVKRIEQADIDELMIPGCELTSASDYVISLSSAVEHPEADL